MNIKFCIFCDKKLTKQQLSNKNKYCSSVCFGKSHSKEKNPTWKNRKIPCLVCNKLLNKKQIANKGKYCSIKCRGIGIKKYPDNFCQICNKKIAPKKKFCSRECRSIWSKEYFKGKNNPNYGKKHTAQAIKQMRLAKIKKIKKNYGICFPNYNKKACEYFKKFDKKNNTKGRYAMYGGGEYFIEELGYWPDYINFSMKLIIEWDEPHHKKQVEKDIRRQQEIQEHYPNFKFIRVKNENIEKIFK